MHSHEGHEHAHEHCHKHEHSHENGHTHAHEHSHEHTHDHDHSGEHSHGHENTSADHVEAVMGYMLEHNRHHAEELSRVVETLKSRGSAEAAVLLEAGVAEFQRGNDRLSEALKLVKEGK